jgi:riboflavin kinase/FMN adenylyltransferase
MKLFEGLETLTEPFSSSTVAIGTFDGIHVGHQAIINAAVREGAENGRTSLVFTFDRHPADLLAPGRAPDYLTTPQQRNQYVAELGVDGLVVAAFDRTLAELAPDAFVEQILISQLAAKEIVVGENFAFGKNRSGDVAYLTDAQARFGFKLFVHDPVVVAGLPASSTRVRELLRDGSIQEAELVLGHAYWLAGMVVQGQKLGRQLGYPTANLALSYRQVVPRDGIYAVRVRLDDGRQVDGACSIGDRPTIAAAGHSIETYLLDFNDDLYGRSMEIRCIRRLRNEVKFDSLDALKAQMARDVKQAKRILAAEDR